MCLASGHSECIALRCCRASVSWPRAMSFPAHESPIEPSPRIMLGLCVPARTTSSIDRAGQRWYSHSYNRPNFYRLAAALSWVPRRGRLALARHIGRLAPSLMPAERAVIQKAMTRFTGVTGSDLDTLTVRVFTDFAMCFSDLVSTNRQLATLRTSHVGNVEGVERLASLSGGLISLTAHVGNWELPGRHTWSSLQTRHGSYSAGCGGMARGCASSRARVPPCRWNCSPHSDAARWWACKGTGRSVPRETLRSPSLGDRPGSRSGRSCCPAELGSHSCRPSASSTRSIGTW